MIWIDVALLIFAPSIQSQICGGRVELTPGNPTFSFQSPNYPNPQTFTETDCRWVFVAPNSESMKLNCPVISTKRMCRSNSLVYIQSGEREKLCGELGNVERSTSANKFILRYAYRTIRTTTTTGFTCTASASFASTILAKKTSTTTSTTTRTSTTTSHKCTCGAENLVTRIVGGEDAIKHQFPWVVRLSISNAYLCGGSLISDEWIMTAAHCVDGGTQASDIRAYIGDHDKNTSTETDNTIAVQGIEIFVHPDWCPLTINNDIALIKISKITLTQEISPICLPFNMKDISGKVGRLAGWGRTFYGGSTSSILQWAEVNLLNASECRFNSLYGLSITDNMICAEDTGKGSCHGDSGGPLFLKEDGHNFEVGIVSWGIGCAFPALPGVYADVQVYIDWIEQTTGESFCKK